MIGFTCAYTPLPLIHAAGFVPYRVLPMGDSPDQAGHLLHDNLCPHIKRVLDRALDRDLPDLYGMVFVNSCDAMRRLADGWKRVRPKDALFLIDLPATAEESSVTFLANEFSRLSEALSDWAGQAVSPKQIEDDIERYNELADVMGIIEERIQDGSLGGGSARMQDFYNRASTESIEGILGELKQILGESVQQFSKDEGVPIYLFGNVFSDPEAFSLLESCGVSIVGDDFCTGSRLFNRIGSEAHEDVFGKLAHHVLFKPLCARTLDPLRPAKIAENLLERVRAGNARGVIGHTVKFCDPYLDRLPMIREKLREANVPLLLLEGDCTMRSIGQQRTRIEAFIEMLR